jgi:D-lactate dehydrogenase (cytochrome)
MDARIDRPPAYATAIGILKQRFGARLSTGDSVRAQHAHTTTWIAALPADAVVFAESHEDVVEAVKVCAAYKVPIVAFGAGTSLDGQVNSPRGGICIDTSGMNQIVSVNA